MQKTYLSRRYTLPALHSLGNPRLSEEENLRLYGPCYRLHGHDYRIEVTVSGPVDPRSGLLVQRDELDRIVEKTLLEPLHARNLNEHFANTAGEALALEFYRLLEPHFPPPLELSRVTIRETRKNTFRAGR